MSEKPRRWFQIHLSTAVVFVLASVLSLVLLHGGGVQSKDPPNKIGWPNVDQTRDTENQIFTGWPLHWLWFHERTRIPDGVESRLFVNWFALAVDCLIYLAFIIGICTGNEWRIRRRSKQMTDNP